jgi:hypothetical protein
MGVVCSCQKIECEEETVARILSTMNLSEIETKSACVEFGKCINKEDGYLDFFLFKNFLNKITANNNYKNAQISFFENLRKLDERNQNIKKIGSMIIFLSKGSKFQKVEALYDHFIKYYTSFDEKAVKEFINDLIEANTDNCIQAFRENLGYDVTQNMTEIYKKLRKRQLLYQIYANFERVKIRYFHQSPKFINKNENLNTSVDIEAAQEPNVDYGFDSNIKTTKQFKEDTETYERFNKNQCDLISRQFTLDLKKLNDEEKIIKEFIELAFNHMSGEYMRNWLYEDYLKEKSVENMCI